jgi:hypothetical protein
MTMTWKNIEASGMSEKDKQYMVMYGMPQEWLDELVTDWQEPLMGGLQCWQCLYYLMHKSALLVAEMTLRGSTSIVPSM